MTTNNDQNDAPAKGAKAAAAESEAGERIAKVLARAGLCSRREAEDWVNAGRVAVDGKVLASPAFTVTPKNRITVDGKPLPMKERTRLWLFHKPRGLVTTTHDPEGRPTVFSVLPEDMPRVVTVGRLDINTEGLLLLTNDGGVARVLELPATGWLRRYRVRAYGEVEEAALKELEHGVSLDGIDYGPIEAAIERVQGSNTWLVLGLREGKNREVKRVLASLGLTVNRLIRVSFGPFQLADLEEGEIREIRGRVLRDQLGKRLVVESGADFDAPIVHHIPGDDAEDEGRKRKIRAFTPADETARDRGPRAPRTKMEFIGTGEKRGRDRDERGGVRPYRSEGFQGRGPGGSSGDRPRTAGYRDRPDGDRPRSEGFRGRPEGDRPRSEGFRGRPEGDRPRSEGFRGRPEGDRPRSEGFRGRPEGDRPRSEGFRGRPDGDRPRSEGFRGRSEGDRPRSEGFRGRPEEDRPRSEGYRGRPEGDRPRFEGRSPRPEGGAPEGGEKKNFKPRAEGGFGPRGPRGMNPGGTKGGFKGARGGEGGAAEGRGPGKGPGGPKGSGPRSDFKGGGFKGGGFKGAGPKGSGPRGAGPKGGGQGRGGPRGGRA